MDIHPAANAIRMMTDDEYSALRDDIEEQLNNRPRKCLGYQTPAEVFDKLCGALAA